MKPKQNNLVSAFAVLKMKRGKKKAKLMRKKKLNVPEHTPSSQSSVTKKKVSPRLSLSNGATHSPASSSGEKKKKRSGVTSVPGVPCGNTDADKCFAWLIHPHQPSNFFRDTWEKEPLVIKSRSSEYYKGIFSCNEFDKALRNHNLEFNANIDVVTYIDGVRQTHNPDGRAFAAIVWNYFQNGCSIRWLNPQYFCKSVWKLCSYLQEYFGSFVGANMYLTPPGSQGFAPHYDDIEAFILQIEGRKQWKVYAPRDPSEVLPRYSSGNLKQDEIGDPVLEVELEPGDLLYFPRGFIHQAKTPESEHSLHITISTYQKHTWGDLLQKILPKALESAMRDDVHYREGLPKDYMNCAGLVNQNTMEREHFMHKALTLTRNLTKYILPDRAADLFAKDFIHSALPPCLTEREKSCSVHGNGERWENGNVCNAVEVTPDSEIRLIRKRGVRFVRENGRLRLYHSFENSRVYKEKDPQYVEIEWDLSPAVEMLIESHPCYVKVKELALTNEEEQMEIASLLYDKGLIETRVPLTEASDEV